VPALATMSHLEELEELLTRRRQHFFDFVTKPAGVTYLRAAVELYIVRAGAEPYDCSGILTRADLVPPILARRIWE
jgi:hypothetical protein